MRREESEAVRTVMETNIGEEKEEMGEYDRGIYEDCWCVRGGCGGSGQMEVYDEGGGPQMDKGEGNDDIYS